MTTLLGRLSILGLSGLAALAAVACANEESPEVGTEEAAHISTVQDKLTSTLIWTDDFNGTALNRGNWSVAGPNDACFNGEAQAYVDAENCGASDHTICVTGGALHLVARKATSPVAACGTQKWYRSARLTTKTHASFNPWQGSAGIRIEARIQMPQIVNGSWPAFWMLGDDLNQWPGGGTNNWPEAGEIDIMEFGSTWSYEQGIGTLHWGAGNYSAFDGDQHVQHGPGWTSAINEHDWATYAVEWTPTEIRWYLNGTQFFSGNLTALAGQDFDHGFNVLLNFALGGGGGSNNGDPSPDPVNGFFRNNGTAYMWEQDMAIDYVKVYALSNDAPGTTRVFLGGDSNAASPTEWDSGNWKGDCGGNWAITGVSNVADLSSAHALRCTNHGGQFTGSGITTLNVSAGDARRASRGGDWDHGSWKGECGINEYVSGVSMDPGSKRVHGLRCAAGSGLTNGGQNNCETRVVTADDRGYTGSGDWDHGYYKAECGYDKVVYGVSVNPSSGRPNRILCCSR